MFSVHVAQAPQQPAEWSVPVAENLPVPQSTQDRSAVAEPANLMAGAPVPAQHCVIVVHLMPAAPFLSVPEDDQVVPLTHGVHWRLLQVLHAASTVTASAFQPQSRPATMEPVSHTVHCGG